jgi:RimJ/RimL family protein N-acetyltransferase
VPETCGSVEDVQAWLTELKAENNTPWKRVELGIWQKDVMVGCIGYAALNDVAMIWYWVGKEQTGHGYAADAVQTLVPHLLQEGHTIIEAPVREDNEASKRTLIKSGFTAFGQRNDYIRFRFSGSEAALPDSLAA